MKIHFALAAGIAAAAILCGSAFAAAPVQGLSRLYASDVQGAPQSVVHDAASAYAWLASLSNSRWGTEKEGAVAAPGAGYDGKSYGAGGVADSTFKTIAAGSTVMQVYLGGTANEMNIMYHMDGPTTLLANHFCGARNVPQFKFVKSDKPGVIIFANDGGTNINPAVDSYAYSMTFTIIDKDHYILDGVTSSGGKHGVVHNIQYRMPAAPMQSASAE
jgi:hypothetical protein